MARNKRQAVKNRVAKVPVVMQLEALECGAACLTMVLAYYNKWIPLEQVRLDCGVSRDGSSAANVMKAARHYDLQTHAYKLEPEVLKSEGIFPCIIHWNFNHFVVLNGFRGGKVYLNDPARGNVTVSMQEFDESFTGICMFFEPNENFVPCGKPKSMFSFASRRLKGTEIAIIFTILTGVITALVGMIKPAFSRVFLDRLLSGQNPGWLHKFLILLAIFNIIQIIMSALTAIYSLKITGKMAAVGNATYMWKILKMPMNFFSQRMAGDIQSRQAANAMISNTLINTFAPLLLNTAMMIFYFVVMIRYSPILTAVGIVSLTINAIVSNIISRKRVNITRVSLRDSGKLAAETVAGIDMVETIKASGAENGFFAKWSGLQANVNAQTVKFNKLNTYLGMIPEFVSSLADTAILVLGVFLTMQGKFSIGSIMAFQGYLTLFMTPATTLISAGQTLQEMRTQMERIDDVMEYPDDDILCDVTAGADTSEPRSFQKLTGEIEVKNISFGYAPLAPPLIKDFSVSIKPGSSLAIVGGSGCGKSTISKLIAGLYRPWSGEILFDGKPLSQIDPAIFHGSLAVVDQEVILFEDTIANNIKMWDESIEDFEMILAARDAQIHYDIMDRQKGYNHVLLENGKDFSGGQRQRLEIARVLAQDPTIIILDEATSALDAKTEYEVVKAICMRGITCIVVAHRLSTIRSCDQIILLENGEIKDIGTHEELMENSDSYRELVISE